MGPAPCNTSAERIPLDVAREPASPRRPPPSCKLQHVFSCGCSGGVMKTIAIEEHFITPMYRQEVAANEFRNFYLSSRSEQIGHDIVEQNSDLGAKRLAHMDSAGIDVQVLSFGSPGAQGFAADVAIPMARDANDLAHQAVKAHPDSFAACAALATADPGAAADELGRCVTQLGFKGAMIHGHTRGSFLDEKKYWVIFARAQALDVPL